MHRPKLKYNQQKWIWILMHEMCMFISLSCLQLSHFAEISYFALHHRMGGPSGVYWCDQSSLNHNTYTTWGVTLENIEFGCSPPPMPSTPALFTPTFCLQQNPFQTRGIHPGHHRYKGEIRLTLCDVGWMNARSNRTYVTVLTPKKRLCCWKADPPGSLTFIFQRTYYSNCRKRVKHNLFSLVVWKAGFI